MTDEGKKDTEPWIADKGVKYAYAYDKGGKLTGQLGVPGFPHAVLVDPSGKIVWEGLPAELKPDDIQKATAGALTKPMWEWTAPTKDVRNALLKHKYADALAGAEKLSEADSGPAIKTAIQGMISGRVAAMKSALGASDFLAASEAAADLQQELAGLPEAADAKTVVETIKSNKEAAPIIKAQKAIQDLRSRKLSRSKDIDRAMDEMKKIAKDLPGTCAEKEAKSFLDDLIKAKSKK